MEIIIILIVAFFCGFATALKLGKRKEFALSTDNEALKKKFADIKKKEEQKAQRYRDNDIGDPRNQLRFVNESSLHAVRPVNNEASNVLYALENWIKKYQPEWRFAFEVSMGGFIKTGYAQGDWRADRAYKSYSGKRVDFLIIDRHGMPIIVIEYNGSGHNISDDADDRMAVKRLALKKAGIHLLEIEAHLSSPLLKAVLSERLHRILNSQKDANALYKSYSPLNNAVER